MNVPSKTQDIDTAINNPTTGATDYSGMLASLTAISTIGSAITGYISGNIAVEQMRTNANISRINRAMAERRAVMIERIGEIQAGLTETLATERVGEIQRTVAGRKETTEKISTAEIGAIERATDKETSAIDRIIARDIAHIKGLTESNIKRIERKIDIEKSFLSEIGQEQIQGVRTKQKLSVGQQRARAGAQGLLFGESSANDVIADIQGYGDDDIKSLKNDIVRKAFGIDDQGTNEIFMMKMQGVDKELGTRLTGHERVSGLKMKGLLETGKIKIQSMREIDDLQREGMGGVYETRLGGMERAFAYRSGARTEALASRMQGYGYGMQASELQTQSILTGITAGARTTETLLTGGIRTLGYYREMKKE